MSRKIDIIDGDIPKQTAEYSLVGLYQKPAIEFKFKRSKKVLRFFTRQIWIKETWIIADTIERVERLPDAAPQTTVNQWNLPSQKGLSATKDSKRFFANLHKPDTAPHPNRVKRVTFRIIFKNGQSCTAVADARVFQNFLALAD